MSYFSQHKLIVVLVVIVVFGTGWYALSGGTPSPSLTTTSVAGSSPADRNLVSTLLALRSVKLDATIFSDPAFVNLRDFSTQIVPEPVGRANPFAPLTTSVSVSATGTKSAQIFAPRK